MDGTGVFFGFFGLFFLLMALLPVGLILLAVVVVFSGRDDPDPSSRRPEALYLCAATFVATFTVIFALYGVANAVARLPLDDKEATFDLTTPDATFEPDDRSGRGDEDRGGENDDEVRAAVQAGLLAVVALALLVFHTRRLRSMAYDPAFAAGMGRRVFIGYLYTTCFVAVVVLLVALTITAYSAFSALAPGVAASDGDGSRSDGLVALASGLVLVGGAATVLFLHLREAGRWRPPSTGAVGSGGVASPSSYPTGPA